MNGRLAKRIRRETRFNPHAKRRIAGDSSTGELFNLGERGAYQTLKQAVKEDRRKGVVK